jgi:H+/Cl- antiporter ClcA
LAPAPRTYLLAALLGVPVGAAAGLYLDLVRWLRHLVWDGHEPRLAQVLPLAVAMLVTTTVGGLVVGVVRARHDRSSPHDLDDVLLEVDAAVAADEAAVAAAGNHLDAPRPDTEAGPPAPHSVRWIVRSTVLGVVSLTAGASLGPEAPLLALAMGFGQRVGRLLRLSTSEAVVISAAGALSGLFGGPLGAAVLSTEARGSGARAPRLVGPGIVAGLTGFSTMLLVLPDGGGLRYTLPEDAVGSLSALGWGTLGAVLAALAAAVLLVSVAPARGIAERLPPVPRATSGGLVLGLCALVQPLVLFSGEHEGQDLIDGLATWTVGALLVLVALKVVATAASMATGYFGGQIFPGSFVGMATAALVVAVLPDAPGGVLVAAGAAAGTTVLLRRPLASALIMLFFFPLTSAVPLLVGAGVGAVVVALLEDRLPAPTPVGGH